MFNLLSSMEWGFDVSIVEFFNKLTNSSFGANVFKLFSYLGTELIAIFIIAGLYWCISKERAKNIAVPILLAVTSVNIVKGFFNRLRPFQQSPSTITCRDKSILSVDKSGNYIEVSENGRTYLSSSSSSFPSGHSGTASAMYNGVAYEYKKKPIWIIAEVLCALVMISRMALGVHFMTDVLTGYILSFSIIILYSFLSKKVNIKALNIGILTITGIFTVLSPLYSKAPKDLFSTYGLLVGVVTGFSFEEKYVNFKDTKKWLPRVLRLLIGLVVAFGIKTLLKFTYSWAFEENTIPCNICDFLRYSILAFTCCGLYPILFNKFKFLKD